MKKIYLAGGCFWGVEHYLSLIKGISDTTVGYANSDIDNPSYEDLKAHRSSASETVEVVYDKNIISFSRSFRVDYYVVGYFFRCWRNGDCCVEFR